MKKKICFILAALLLPVVSLAEAYDMCEIPVTDVGPVCIGQTENTETATGCTVFIVPEGMCAASVGDIAADQDLVGTLAAEVVNEAITRAVTNAEGAYRYPAVRDLQP